MKNGNRGHYIQEGGDSEMSLLSLSVNSPVVQPLGITLRIR